MTAQIPKKFSVEVVFDVNVGVKQVNAEVRQIHLVEDQVLESFFQISLPDQNGTLHPALAHHNLEQNSVTFLTLHFSFGPAVLGGMQLRLGYDEPGNT